jgi:hypothetical protein
VRIYEAIDIMNLAQWPLAATLAGVEGISCTCLSWCTGRFEPPTLVVGGSHLIVYRYSEHGTSLATPCSCRFPIRGDVLMWRGVPLVTLSLYWFRGRSADADLQTQPSHDDGTSNASSEGSSNDDMGNAKSESHDDQLSLMSSQTVPAMPGGVSGT